MTRIFPATKKVGLFIPCYVDQLYPQVGLATVEILQRCGVAVEFPQDQTCCGQPMANTGCTEDTRPLAEKFLRVFGRYDYVVAPSGSYEARRAGRRVCPQSAQRLGPAARVTPMPPRSFRELYRERYGKPG